MDFKETLERIAPTLFRIFTRMNVILILGIIFYYFNVNKYVAFSFLCLLLAVLTFQGEVIFQKITGASPLKAHQNETVRLISMASILPLFTYIVYLRELSIAFILCVFIVLFFVALHFAKTN